LMEAALSNTEPLQKLARQYGNTNSMLFIARGITFPVALEGALKLKEISYIHAEGYSGAELKHGPIALLDENMPVLSLLASGSVFDKMLSNCQEAKAREAQMIAITNQTIPNGYEATFDDVILYPACHEWVAPLLGSIPLQLFSYYTAEFLGKDVDQPRNLAKSVTVE
jgi:glutamine---fructose-6-phosphate transaminase (isomerizing)